MAIISDDQLRTWKMSSFARLSVTKNSLLETIDYQYRVWHRNEMNKFSQAIDSTRQKRRDSKQLKIEITDFNKTSLLINKLIMKILHCRSWRYVARDI